MIWINPLNKKVAPNAIGLFLTESSDAAKRAWFYCRHVSLCNDSNEITYVYRKCHAKVQDLKDIRKCPCKNLAKARYEEYSNDDQVFKSKK